MRPANVGTKIYLRFFFKTSRNVHWSNNELQPITNTTIQITKENLKKFYELLHAQKNKNKQSR